MAGENAVVHFEVVGQDGEKLQKFYSDLFGWKIDANNEMKYGMVPAVDGKGIGGGISGGGNNGGHVTFYVAVQDCAAALEKAEKLGGKTVMEPMQVPGGPEIALFTDPEGHLIGLAKDYE